MAGRLDDLGLVHADEGAEDGQVLGGVGTLQSLDGLAGHLCQALAGDEGFTTLLPGDDVGNAHHAAAHEDGEENIGRVIADILLRLGIRHHKEVGAAGIGGDELGQSLNFQFCAFRSIRRGRKMDVVEAEAALCHPVCRHRAVDAAGQHIEGAAGGAHRQATLALYFRAMDIRTVIADLHDDLELRVLDVHPQVVVPAQQIGTQLPHQLRAGHGEGLVGTAGLDLEGLDAVEAVAQIILGGLADGVEILLTDHSTAEGREAEHLAHPLKGEVHINVFLFRLHVEGGLGAVDAELAHRLETVAQDLHHRRFKLVAVEALQGHFALIAHNDFAHNSFS